jgi:hypothetical protein
VTTIAIDDPYDSIYGAALNGKGQLALPAVINKIPDKPGVVPATIALLTPTGS